MKITCITIITSIILSLAGCSQQKPKTEPIWQQVKISDLASPYDFGKNKKNGNSLQMLDFTLISVELPIENVEKLIYITSLLNKENIEFNDPESFHNNDFTVHFGQVQIWDSIAAQLKLLKAKKNETVNLLIKNKHINEYTIKNFSGEKTIFYQSEFGSLQGISHENGSLALRLKAKLSKRKKGVAKLFAVPAYLTSEDFLPAPMATLQKTKDYPFKPLAFNLEMSPGDFIMLAPSKLDRELATLQGLFFYNPESNVLPPQPVETKKGEIAGIKFQKSPSARLYFIFCTRLD